MKSKKIYIFLIMFFFLFLILPNIVLQTMCNIKVMKTNLAYCSECIYVGYAINY